MTVAEISRDQETPRVHEVNAGTLNPGDAAAWGAPHFVCRCLLIEVGARLVAVDTGLGLRDVAEPERRLGAEWLAMARPSLDPEETLVKHLERLGRTVADVTDVVLTHGHRDHVGGLADLPDARVHAMPGVRALVERAAAGEDAGPSPWPQWEHGVTWAEAPSPAGEWRGLATYALPGVLPTVRLVDLPGHAAGHAGVLVELPGEALLHVGDAAFHPAQYLGAPVPPAVAAFTVAMQADAAARVATEQQLARIARLPEVRILTAHGPVA